MPEQNQANKVIIRFMGDINPQTTNILINTIENKIRENKNDFLFLISSHGGDVPSGISIYNYLKNLSINIETHNFGIVESIASLLYCCGSKRSSSKTASFLIHGINWNGGGDEKQINEVAKTLKTYREHISDIISKNCNKSSKQIQKMMFNNSRLNAEEAKKIGLVDEIKELNIDTNTEIISIG